MRIAYLIGRYPAVSHTFILREVRALRKLGAEVRTFSVWASAEAELLSRADREEAATTTTLLPLAPARVTRALAALAARPRALLPLMRDARAVRPPGLRGAMLAGSWMLEALVLWDACRREGIRHVHAHLNGTAPAVALLVGTLGREVDGAGAWTWSFTVHGPTEFYDVALERLDVKVRKATFVVAISDFARSQLMALVDEDHWDKLRIVHCGVDPAVFAPPEHADGEGAELDVLCVSRLTRIKGQPVLLDAVSRLRADGVPVRLTIVGDGPKRADFERISQERGLDGAVRFTGAIGQDSIRREFEAADVFCLASFAEGVPVVLMEAMAMGKPVVASRIMGVGELVEDGVSGRLVAPGRSDLLADALAELAEDPERRRQMGEAGRRKVIEEFDAEREAGRLLELFRIFAAQAG